ncbi:glutathione S-transferase U10-like [Amaranthus tricolor]|uniref:glutathione S-transferase U10-like n=1 Tax=Amaranthus tricolor TaxID=29722 RepID=UPI0025904F06|nr:glutathione S-transferase U10-like [Amaranthus tricolor]
MKLVHNGLPLAESLVILEHIDETWTNTPYLLPKDSCQRAKHRFWAAYFQQVSEIFGRAVILSTQGKQTDEKMKEFWNKMDVAEEFMKEILPNSSPSLQENFQPRYLDIVLYSFFGNCDVVEDFLGVKPLCTERFSLLTLWIKALGEVPEFKEVSVPVQKLVEFLRAVRQNI